MTANPPPSSTRSIPSPADRGQGVRAASGIPADFRSRPAFSSAILAMSRGGGVGRPSNPFPPEDNTMILICHPPSLDGNGAVVLPLFQLAALTFAIFAGVHRGDRESPRPDSRPQFAPCLPSSS